MDLARLVLSMAEFVGQSGYLPLSFSSKIYPHFFKTCRFGQSFLKTYQSW